MGREEVGKGSGKEGGKGRHDEMGEKQGGKREGEVGFIGDGE